VCATQSATLSVCPASEVVTVTCAYARCGRAFAKRINDKRKKFCSTKCRVYASRAPGLARRNRWTDARFRDRGLEFDGRYVGSIRNMGPLALFEKEK